MGKSEQLADRVPMYDLIGPKHLPFRESPGRADGKKLFSSKIAVCWRFNLEGVLVTTTFLWLSGKLRYLTGTYI